MSDCCFLKITSFLFSTRLRQRKRERAASQS